jgi:hypothetical protein
MVWVSCVQCVVWCALVCEFRYYSLYWKVEAIKKTIYTIVVGICRSRNFLGAQFRTSVSQLA